MNQSKVPQHKRMAMGSKAVGFKKGGIVPPRPAIVKSGVKDSPLEKVRRSNGMKGV